MKHLLAFLIALLPLGAMAQVGPIAPLLTPSQQTGIRVNPVTYAATVNIPVDKGMVNTISLTGNIALNTTNRPTASTLGRRSTVFITADASARTVTLNAAWRVYGTNTTFTIPANKQAFISLVVTGSAESDVKCAFDVSN